MSKVVNVDFRTKEEKRAAFKAKLSEKIQDGKDWFTRNKEYIITLTPVIVGGVTTVAKVVSKRVNLRKQEELKDLYCYDRSLGHYWRLRRELSNKEWLEIDQRKKNGERLSDILCGNEGFEMSNRGIVVYNGFSSFSAQNTLSFMKTI